jgi:hypothetical protein
MAFCCLHDSQSAIRSYVDGILDIDRAGTTFTEEEQSDHYIRIGAQGGGERPYFNGIIDEVRIYDRELSESEVQDIYTNGTTSSATDYTTYLSFDEPGDTSYTGVEGTTIQE